MNAFIAQAESGQMSQLFSFGLEQLLHGEHRLTLERALPTKATLTHSTRIAGVYDTGKHARLDIEITSRNEAGELLMTNVFSLIARGAGGLAAHRRRAISWPHADAPITCLPGPKTHHRGSARRCPATRPCSIGCSVIATRCTRIQDSRP